MANFASDHWHQIYIGNSDGGGQSLAGTSLYNNSLTGAVFFSETNTTSNAEQLWQLYPFNSTYYVLRSKSSGPLGYLTVKRAPEENTPGRTVPLMTNASLADDSMFWRIEPWGDGTFFFTNAANGSAWHLQLKPNSLMAMSSNITTPPRDGQRFSFKQLGQIQNANFSTVVTPTGTAASIPSGNITNAPEISSSPSSSSGLSTGAKAGIGAGVGVAVLVALLILGFFLMKRRKRAKATVQGSTPPYEPIQQQNYETEAKHIQSERPGELDAPVADPAELNSDNRYPVAELNSDSRQTPAELPTENGR
ncbi:hypothetical protein BKA61DRAFT_610824 [Leptodontidium sp. MPI-SDFR-AT-0119]|nr:hypothetical protein BKA61DRAFT_610824 [Leptodontidium sp. MPI-SDFR-AT-0119]